MYPRSARFDLHDALGRQAAVALLGPRQVGKTTLALEVAAERNAVYLDLQDPEQQAKLDSPALYFDAVADSLVILDEIHRVPGLFDVLRGVIDRGRREGRGLGRFLILGSAALGLMQQSGESLAGRIAFVELAPLSPLEISGDRRDREALWLRGGFPQAFLAPSDAVSLALRRDFIRTYLELDVPSFGLRLPTATLNRLWTMLAHRQGAILNASDLSRALEVSVQSVNRYCDLLVDMLLVRRLPPYVANIGKRLVKSPKLYVRDSGLVHALLNLQTLDQLSGHPVVGASWEGFVLEALIGAAPPRTQAAFYRTRAGAELDLVLTLPDGAIWAIEIKRALSARPGKGFHQAVADLQPAQAFVVHAGEDRYPISEQAQGIGFMELARLLQDWESA